jgi:hypothetical protein
MKNVTSYQPRAIRHVIQNPILAAWTCLLCLLSAAIGCGRPTSAGAPRPPVESNVAQTADDDEAAAQDAALPADEPPATGDPASPQAASSAGMVATASTSAEAPASPPASRAPAADRTPRRPGEAEKITFEDLNLGMQADVVFRPFMLDNSRVKELEGKRIAIAGYMHGGQASQRGIKDFILLKNTQCKFGPGGQADHLANVILRDGTSTRFTPSDIRVEGTLKIEPFQGPDGNTWSIYRLDAAQVRN